MNIYDPLVKDQVSHYDTPIADMYNKVLARSVSGALINFLGLL